MKRVAALLVGLLLAGSPSTEAADLRAAERQYRTARRLAAESSPEAQAALEKVIELDPAGPLADDALLEQALLEAPAGWPERTGVLDAARAARAIELLDRLIEQFSEGDRADEAFYHRALLRLEPVASYDASGARVDLTRAATADSVWSSRARYALAWLHEYRGDDSRAQDAYQRLVIDGPGDAVGIRARVGLARVLLRRGQYGPAARWLQEAIDDGVADPRAPDLRELAVRSLLREAGAGDTSLPNSTRTGVRNPSGFTPTAGGGILLGDRKGGRVLELDAAGAPVGEWTVDEPNAVAVDARGRRFAAGKTTLFRLDDGGRVTPLASLGEFVPTVALAADASGRFWLLDRRGRSIGRIDPGTGGPRTIWEGDGRRLLSMVWDGRKLIAIEGKKREVVALDGNVMSVVVRRGTLRPAALAVDAAGRIAVLDARSGSVRFVRVDGTLERTGFVAPAGTSPIAVGLGPGGELHLFGSESEWVVYR